MPKSRPPRVFATAAGVPTPHKQTLPATRHLHPPAPARATFRYTDPRHPTLCSTGLPFSRLQATLTKSSAEHRPFHHSPANSGAIEKGNFPVVFAAPTRCRRVPRTASSRHPGKKFPPPAEQRTMGALAHTVPTKEYAHRCHHPTGSPTPAPTKIPTAPFPRPSMCRPLPPSSRPPVSVSPKSSDAVFLHRPPSPEATPPITTRQGVPAPTEWLRTPPRGAPPSSTIERLPLPPRGKDSAV